MIKPTKSIEKAKILDSERGDGMVIGGGTLMGIGAGFFFLRSNVLAFVGCILIGIGLGLMLAPLISAKSK